VAATAADVVRQAVRVVLDLPIPPAPTTPVTRRTGYDPWGGTEPDDWADDHDLVEDGGHEAWGYQATAPPEPPETSSPGLPRLAAAAVVGLRAAAWWLVTRQARRCCGCVVVGVLAGVAAYALGPAALTVASAVAALTLATRSAEFANTLSV